MRMLVTNKKQMKYYTLFRVLRWEFASVYI